MKVIEHGNLHKTYICRCNSCYCLFNFFLHETKKVDVRDSYTEWHMTHWIKCPECGYQNIFREDELKGEELDD